MQNIKPDRHPHSIVMILTELLNIFMHLCWLLFVI